MFPFHQRYLVLHLVCLLKFSLNCVSLFQKKEVKHDTQEKQEAKVPIIQLEVLPSLDRPKEFHDEMANGCVDRKCFKEVWDRLETSVTKSHDPGLYIAGPPGVGKSTVLYWCACQGRSKGWIVIYIVSCFLTC